MVVNGVEVRGKVVVSGIGAHRTYEKLVRPLADPKLAKHAEGAMARIEQATELTVAFIFLFLGLDTSALPPEEADERSHNTWIYPECDAEAHTAPDCLLPPASAPQSQPTARRRAHRRYDYTQMEKDIEGAAPWSRPMPFFVASGSAKDAGWKANFGPHKKTIMVISQCPWSWVAPWAELSHAQRENSAGYAAFKASYQLAAMEQGFRKVFPKLEPYITHATVGTPLTTNNFLGTTQGECYGRSATPARWLCPDFSPHTPVPNLLLTGQDVVTLGLTGGIASGYLTANVLAGYGEWENVILQREIAHDLGLGKIF